MFPVCSQIRDTAQVGFAEQRVAVGEHDPLGLAGGAPAVENHRQILETGIAFGGRRMACGHHGLPPDHGLGAGGHGDGHAIARFYPQGNQCGGAAVYLIGKLPVGGGGAEKVGGQCIQAARYGANERFVHRHLGVVDGVGNVSVAREPGFSRGHGWFSFKTGSGSGSHGLFFISNAGRYVNR